MNGDDLRAIGILSGPQMGKILAEMEAHWETENYRPTKELLLELLQSQS